MPSVLNARQTSKVGFRRKFARRAGCVRSRTQECRLREGSRSTSSCVLVKASPDAATGLFPAGKRQAKVQIPAVWLAVDSDDVLAADIGHTLEDAITAGATAVILRERGSSSADLFRAAAQLKEAIRDRAVFLVEDRSDIASACGADGVLLSSMGESPLCSSCR